MLVTLLPPNNTDVEHVRIAEGVGDLLCSPERPIRAPTRHPGLGQVVTRKTSKSIRCCVSPESVVSERVGITLRQPLSINMSTT